MTSELGSAVGSGRASTAGLGRGSAAGVGRSLPPARLRT